MEEKRTGLVVLVAVLTLLLGGLIGFFVSFKILENKCVTTNVNNTNNSGISNESASNSGVSNTVANNVYDIFSKKLKSQIAAKYSSNNMEYQFVNSSVIEKGYVVYLNQTGSLFVKYNDNTLNTKFGDYKIADNVLSFYVIDEGQGGEKTLYFINENGTVGSADVEFGVLNNNTIEVKTDLGYKNIVSVVNGGFGLEYSGGNGAIFIDIDGNIFNRNFE